MGIGNQDTTANETNTQTPVPVTGTLKNFYARINSVTPSGGNATITLTLRKNAVDTALTCVATRTNGTGAGPASCSDTTHSVSVTAGDLISISFSFVTSTSRGSGGWAVEIQQ
jgi:hypothetical protein